MTSLSGHLPAKQTTINPNWAAVAMKIPAADLKGRELVDEVIPEPLGGAHKEPDEVAGRIADCLESQLEELEKLETEELLDKRYQRLLAYGEFQD